MNHTDKIIETYDSAVMGSYKRFPLSPGAVSGGAKCHDADGREFIDFGSGIGTNSLGYANLAWAEAVSVQAHKLQHVSNYYYNGVVGEFAAALTKATASDKLFFGNSGAEANECAIKIARKYSYDKYGAGRAAIITLEGSFHGRTMATLSATGQEALHDYFFPFLGGFVHVPPNDIEALRAAVTGEVCAIMFEPLMGECGILELDQEFVGAIFDIAKEHDLLTITDEVQCGAGRTGKLLCAEHFGVLPDIITMAKGIGGGLPIGICLARGAAAEVLTPGTHGSTFGGNPVVCAGAKVVLDTILSGGFLDEVTKKGGYIRSALLKMPKVVDVTGRGLMIGARLEGIPAADVVSAALDRGLLCLMAKDRLRLLPPLNIGWDEINAGLAILGEILS